MPADELTIQRKSIQISTFMKNVIKQTNLSELTLKLFQQYAGLPLVVVKSYWALKQILRHKLVDFSKRIHPHLCMNIGHMLHCAYYTEI